MHQGEGNEMVTKAEVVRQSDGTWLARIDSPYRVFGVDLDAEGAATAAGRLLLWAVHPQAVEVEYRVVEAGSPTDLPVHHPQRPTETTGYPQHWLVVPVTVRRLGRWSYRGTFDGFYAITANSGSVDDAMAAAERVLRRTHGESSKNGPAFADFVLEAQVAPEERNFEEDDDPMPLNATTLRMLGPGLRLKSATVPGLFHIEYDDDGNETRRVSLKDQPSPTSESADERGRGSK